MSGKSLKALLHLTGWRGRLLDVGLGAVSVLALAPFHFWPVMIVALAVLAYRLRLLPPQSPKPYRSAFGRGFLFGLGYFLCGTFWIGSAFIARGPEFIPIMPPMIFGLALLLASFWGLAGLFYNRLKASAAMSGFGFAAIFTLAEITRGHILGGFPWNLPGYIFEAGGAISQSASVIGIYGLTAIVFLIAGLLSLPHIYRKTTWTVSGMIVVVLFSTGWMRLSSAEIDYVDTVKLRIVKVAFEQADQFNAQGRINIANRYLTNSILPGAEDITHIIWPEGAVAGLAVENETLINAMSGALRSIDDTPPIWLLNSLRHESRPHLENEGKIIDDYFNSSVAISFAPDGSAAIEGLNDKAKLVPFGEFIPFGKWLENKNLGPLSTALSSISPAPQKTLSEFPGLPKLSPQICYEIIFPAMTPRPKKGERAQWILNQSNDGWYGQSIGPYQHANQARYRAIEEGLPIIRATANGLSGAIDPYGRWNLDDSMPKPNLIYDGVIDTTLPKALTMTVFHKAMTYYIFLLCLMICLFIAYQAKTSGTLHKP